jgi:hypothetical protein
VSDDKRSSCQRPLPFLRCVILRDANEIMSAVENVVALLTGVVVVCFGAALCAVGGGRSGLQSWPEFHFWFGVALLLVLI